MGIPIQVQRIGEDGLAHGRTADGTPYASPVQTALLDDLPQVGDWVLVHIDTAIRSLEAGEAHLIADALEALERAARGDSFEHLLGDLIHREPQLPPHLQTQTDPPASTGTKE